MLKFLRPADRPVVEGLEAHEVIFAKTQSEYTPLRTIRAHNFGRAVLSRWTLTEDERREIAAGADIYLELMTFEELDGTPKALQPIRIAVGRDVDPDYIREQYSLPAKP